MIFHKNLLIFYLLYVNLRLINCKFLKCDHKKTNNFLQKSIQDLIKRVQTRIDDQQG